jgi:hypothetical protein
MKEIQKQNIFQKKEENKVLPLKENSSNMTIIFPTQVIVDEEMTSLPEPLFSITRTQNLQSEYYTVDNCS